ncbi:MAG: hypothetical protein HY074_10665 [Deltaproteobacteria bacterium]|nr:hypothetical protein [Deltaproteobacteria bacterium]
MKKPRAEHQTILVIWFYCEHGGEVGREGDRDRIESVKNLLKASIHRCVMLERAISDGHAAEGDERGPVGE